MSEQLKFKYTGVFEKLIDSKAKSVVCVGGSGSSKSYSMAQVIAYKVANEQKKVIGVCRKTSPALRKTALRLVIDILKSWGIYQFGEENKSDLVFRYHPTDSIIFFFGLDDPEKIKSFNANYIWMEEATDFTWEDYLMLKLRINNPSSDKERNRIYMTLNPVDENCWIKNKLVDSGDDVEIIHSTYKNNPFLPKDARQVIMDLENEDANFYRIYALGEWGRLENLIYSNYRIVPDMPSEFQKESYGVDFGFVNPSTVVHVGLIDKELWWDEEVYQTHLTNTDLIEKIKPLKRLSIYADSAEPQRIEELKRAGLMSYPANKDVKLGIDTVKRHRLNITSRSVNLIKEVRGYQRKTDKDGHVIEEPVKFNDHALDAGRYGTMGIGTPSGFAFDFI